MKPTIVREDTGYGGWIYWEIITDNPIDPIDAQKMQKNAGYDVKGYDFTNFRCNKMSDGKYKSHWRCYNSAD